MKHSMWIVGRMAAVGSMVCVLPAAARAQQKLTVDQVMERYIAASGGRAAYNKITSNVTKGTMEIAPNGLKGTFTQIAKAPNQAVLTQNVAGFGEIRQGFDGKEGWSQDPRGGLRTIEGIELANLKREAAFNPQLRWKQLYKTAQMLGVKVIDGKKVYAIQLTPPIGKPLIQYFDVKTFLMVGMDLIQQTPERMDHVHMIMGDYRPVAGIKEPFTVRQKIGALEITLKTDEVKTNVKVDDTAFAKPAKPTDKPTRPFEAPTR
jgi:hypothetical protein